MSAHVPRTTSAVSRLDCRPLRCSVNVCITQCDLFYTQKSKTTTICCICLKHTVCIDDHTYNGDNKDCWKQHVIFHSLKEFVSVHCHCPWAWWLWGLDWQGQVAMLQGWAVTGENFNPRAGLCSELWHLNCIPKQCKSACHHQYKLSVVEWNTGSTRSVDADTDRRCCCESMSTTR